MNKKSVCVVARGNHAIVTVTGEQLLLLGLAGRSFLLSHMLTELSAGRSMSEWEKRLYDKLHEVCGEAYLSINACGFTVEPVVAMTSEISQLVSAVTCALRECLEDDEWRIVSQSCNPMAAVKVVH